MKTYEKPQVIRRGKIQKITASSPPKTGGSGSGLKIKLPPLPKLPD